MKQIDLIFIMDALKEARHHIELYREDGYEDVLDLIEDALNAAGDLEDQGYEEEVWGIQ